MATTDSEQNSYVRQETSFPDDLHVRMKRIWLNEQYSPELLPFEKDIVNEFLHRLEIQVRSLKFHMDNPDPLSKNSNVFSWNSNKKLLRLHKP
jgi:hypothetical protein